MPYNEFLISLTKKSPATAAWSVEINAEKYGKTVRQVSADFKEMFGTYL